MMWRAGASMAIGATLTYAAFLAHSTRSKPNILPTLSDDHG